MLMSSDVMKASILAAGRFWGAHSFKELALERSLGGRMQAQSENQGNTEVRVLFFK